LYESEVSVFRNTSEYLRGFMVSDMVINVLNKPDASIFREFTPYSSVSIISCMITHVSKRLDASTFRELTQCFKGSMEEMHNISISILTAADHRMHGLKNK
jgi:hypothetical protein